MIGGAGNDAIVGGSGRDHMYGGWGNDLLNADDDLTTNGGLNNVPETAPTYEDRAYFYSARSIGVENANDAGEVACDKPEAQAKSIERYVFSNALRLRFRLVNPVPADSDGRGCRTAWARGADMRSCGPVLNLRFSGRGILVARIIHDESSRGSGSRGR